MDNGWKSYFSFTKKERTGIITLLLLIGISTIVPYVWPEEKLSDATAQQALNARRQRIAAVLADTVQKVMETLSNSKNTVRRKVEEFAFDPNTLDADGWWRLGIADRTVRTIQNYLKKGGRFRKVEDLQRVYGFREEDYKRLAPYVKLPTVERYRKPAYIKRAPELIDINLADTAAFIGLPGIGPALARRIINFREKLGGFYSVEQVGDTYGLADSTFRLIKPRLQCAPGDLRKININTADAAALKQHPYIRWNIANLIVQYRQQHGAYRSVEDLRQIALVTPELYEKVKEYLAVE